MSHIVTYNVVKSKEGFTECARLIRDHKLHNDSYSAFYWFAYHGRWAKDVETISIAYVDNTPIGIAIKVSGGGMMGCVITCYVCPKYRRKGIGSELVQKIVSKKVIDDGAHQFPIGFPKYEGHVRD